MAQAVWNELPLLTGAMAAVWFTWKRQADVLDPELSRTMAAAAIGGLALLLTVFKHGADITALSSQSLPFWC